MAEKWRREMTKAEREFREVILSCLIPHCPQGKCPGLAELGCGRRMGQILIKGQEQGSV